MFFCFAVKNIRQKKIHTPISDAIAVHFVYACHMSLLCTRFFVSVLSFCVPSFRRRSARDGHGRRQKASFGGRRSGPGASEAGQEGGGDREKGRGKTEKDAAATLKLRQKATACQAHQDNSSPRKRRNGSIFSNSLCCLLLFYNFIFF